jgi:N-acylneuraminate cytidylyltransferase
MGSTILSKITKDEIIALIPARGGSKSIPRKNIRMFQGYPLIAYSIAAAKLSCQINRVIVSTDSEEIADIAKKYGAEVPFLRPAEYARDDSPDIEFVLHAIKWLSEHEGNIPEYIIHMRPTAPIRDRKMLEAAILKVKTDVNATSLRSGSICAHPPYKWYKQGVDGYLEPLFDGMTNDEVNIPRQQFPTVYMPNGYVDILKTEFIIKSNLMYGERIIGFETQEIPDIDTEDDLLKLSIYPALSSAVEEMRDYLGGTYEKLS